MSRWTLSWMVRPSLDFENSDVHCIVSVGLAYAKGHPIKAYEIAGSALDPAAQVTKNVLTVKELLAPLSRPEIGVVRCLGLNYSDHAVRTYQTHRVEQLLTLALRAHTRLSASWRNPSTGTFRDGLCTR